MDEKLTEEEKEILHMLAEDASEVIQTVTKILRHGFRSYNPDSNASSMPNEDHLIKELNDLDTVRHFLAISRRSLAFSETSMQAEVVQRKLRYTHKLEIPKFMRW